MLLFHFLSKVTSTHCLYFTSSGKGSKTCSGVFSFWCVHNSPHLQGPVMPHQMLNVVIEVFEPFPYPLPAYPTYPFVCPRCMVNEKIGSLHDICIIEYEIYIQLVERTSLHDKSADISKHAGSVETICIPLVPR